MRRWIGTAMVFFAGGMVGALAVSSATAQGPTRRYLNLDRREGAAYSQAVVAGNTVYLAGRIGVDPATGKPPADVEREIRLVLDGMKAQLVAAGLTMDDLVSVQVFCSDLTLYDRFNAVYRTYFTTGDLPARAFIGSGPLLWGGRFEVQGIAVRQ